MTSTDPNPPAVAATKPKPDRSYMVLFRRTDDPENGPDRWTQLATPVAAANAEQAIRKLAGGLTDAADYEFVAAPARSWQPVRVKVETVQRIKLEDA